MNRSSIVRPPTKRNVPMKRNKSVKLSTKPKLPMRRNKSATLLTPRSASPATTMKRNARKSLTNLANMLMFPNMNKCPSKNATTSMCQNVTKCHNSIAPHTLCLTVKKSPTKNAQKCPKSIVMIFNSTNQARKSTGNAKKKSDLTRLPIKQNTTRSANKLKYPNALPSTKKNVLMRKSKIVKPLTKRNVLKNTSKSARLSTKPPMKRNKSAQLPTKPKPRMRRNKSVTLLTLKSASPPTTMKRTASKSLANLANTLMFPNMNKCPSKNVTMLMFQNKYLKRNATMSPFPTAKMSLKSIAPRTRFPTAKRSPTKSATMNTSRSATLLTLKSLSKRRSSTVFGLNTDTITIRTTANLLNNK